MVTFIVKHYFIFDNPVKASCIVTILVKSNKSDIRLFILGILIVDYENNPLLKCVIKKVLYFSKFLLSILCSELSQVASVLIKVTIKVVEPVKLPVEIVVLDFVFAERHLKSIIKLAISVCKENAPYKNDNQFFDISFFQGSHVVTGS